MPENYWGRLGRIVRKATHMPLDPEDVSLYNPWVQEWVTYLQEYAVAAGVSVDV